MYLVQEEDGEVTVFVMILSGELTSDVEIAFTTRSRSASGTGVILVQETIFSA